MSERTTFELHATEVAAIFERGNAKIIASRQMAASYGQLAIRNALVLNGGALFAGAALMGALGQGNNLQTIAAGFFIACAFFVAGIITGAMSSYYAYDNLLKWSEWYEQDVDIQATEKTKYFFKDHYLENKEKIDNALNATLAERNKIGSKLSPTNYGSIGLAVVAYFCFTVGCILVGGTIATA